MEETLKSLTPLQLGKYERWPYADKDTVIAFLSVIEGLTYAEAVAKLNANNRQFPWGPGTRGAIMCALNEARGITVTLAPDKRGQ